MKKSLKKQTKKDLRMNKGTKDDIGKIDLTLFDPYFYENVCLVLEAGQVKYVRGNWQLDLEPERLLAALLRHTFAIMKGETYDKETKLPHSAHIACNAMFLNFYERHGRFVKLEHYKG